MTFDPGHASPNPAPTHPRPAPDRSWRRLLTGALPPLDALPHGLLALVARLGLAATFWISGQTKVQGLVLDPIRGHLALGWPRLSESALDLFQHEYRLPLLDPWWAATLAAGAEHLLPLLLLLGLATRWAALGLLGMTLVIQVFVYPLAWPVHLTWAAGLLYLIGRGAGPLSIDALIGARRGRS